MLTVIGISGKKQSGKDTLCQSFIKQSAWPCHKIGFADALKEELAKACGVSTEFIEKHKADFRVALQWWGTDFRRKFKGDDYWVKQLLSKLLPIGNTQPEVVVIPDVRFVSEADVLKEVGAFLVRINRASCADDKHQSEIELDHYGQFDYTIYNDLGIEHIDKYALFLLNHLNIPIKQYGNIPTTGLQPTK